MISLRALLLVIVLAALTLLVRPDDAVTASFVTQADAERATFLYRRAEENVRLALIRQPWNASAQRRLAELLIDQRRFDEVPAAIDLARDLGATPIDLAALNAQLAAQTGQFEIAAVQWLIVAQAKPAAYPHAVDAYLQAENWAAAQSTAEQWLTAEPDHVEARLALAKIVALDDAARARELLAQIPIEQARLWMPALDETERAMQLMLLGRAYLSAGDLTLARRAFKAATEANPMYAEAYAYDGFTLDQLGRDGASQLDRAVEIDRDLVVARYFRARHTWLSGNLDRAIEDLLFAAERDPQNPLIAAELGQVYEQRGDLAAAEKWLTTARDLKADDPLGWKALAELYAGHNYGPREQALKIAQQAAAMAPDDAEARVWLGVAQLLNGERAIAEGELLRAAELDPKSALAQSYLGRLYGRDNEAGRQAYERAIALDPAGPIGAQAKRTLALP
ncbi:MAG: tetratricopeptide repeat protein [Anaerolineae bacterium]